MKAAIIVFPGSNRERDVARAIHTATGVKPQIVWHGDATLPQADLIVLPGGFSYGDYLRSGAIAAHSPIMRDVKVKAAKGVPVLGICNGFQILVEAQLLPGALMRNAGLKFQCRFVSLKVEQTDTMFTREFKKGQVIRVPIAHADGNYTADAETIKRLEGDGQIAFRYCSPEGEAKEAANANGSVNNIAGVFSANRRILGMMPHPEDAVENLHGRIDGSPLFASIANAG